MIAPLATSNTNDADLQNQEYIEACHSMISLSSLLSILFLRKSPHIFMEKMISFVNSVIAKPNPFLENWFKLKWHCIGKINVNQ